MTYICAQKNNLGEDTFRLATGESLGVLGCATADIWLSFTATKKDGLNLSVE